MKDNLENKIIMYSATKREDSRALPLILDMLYLERANVSKYEILKGMLLYYDGRPTYSELKK